MEDLASAVCMAFKDGKVGCNCGCNELGWAGEFWEEGITRERVAVVVEDSDAETDEVFDESMAE